MSSFVDQVKVFVQAGKGGNGCASVLREKYKPLGGPNGGSGGDGGSVILRVDPQVTTLLDYHHLPHRKADNGEVGLGGNKDGSKAADLILPVPLGTVVKSESGEVLADLSTPGAQFLAAEGGVGGKGNAALATKRRKAPGFALLGELGEEATYVLELKSVADVALVGFPSAGKSSLIGAVSQAKPKIADYPFTTLVPNLGVVRSGETKFTIADVPGLIPGAAQGKGLGLDFLRHIERCGVICHVVDCASFDPSRNPVDDIKALEKELAAYESDLDELEGFVPIKDRPRVIVLNKMDIPDAKELVQLSKDEILAFDWPVFAVSTLDPATLEPLLHHLAAMVSEQRAQNTPTADMAALIAGEVDALPTIIRPLGRRDDNRYTVEIKNTGTGPVFQVRGRKPERWVQQTDFANDEAVGFLADRLAGLGVEEKLVKLGARPGDTVVIGPLDGGVVFDWEPALSTGAELLGARGEDLRLYENSRRTNKERREEYYAWMDAKAAARGELQEEREAGLWTDPQSE